MEVLTQLLHQVCFVLFFAFLGWGALSDYRDFIIPNRICLAIVLLYPAFVMTSPNPVDWMSAVIVALVVLGITTVMFSFGVMGGGDVKFFSATALWAGSTLALPFLLVTALAGGVLAVYFMARMYFPRRSQGEVKLHRRSVPYGVAIAAGGMFVAGQIAIS